MCTATLNTTELEQTPAMDGSSSSLSSASTTTTTASTTVPKPQQQQPQIQIDLDEIQLLLDGMRRKEQTYERKSVSQDEHLSSVWRKMLIEWMYYVIDYCHLERQCVSAASYYLDVAMSRGLCCTREEHQCAAATALQMSLKLFGTAVIQLDKLVKLGQGQFSEDDVCGMESNICNALSWRLHPPSTYCFLRQYERLIPNGICEETKDMMGEVTKILCELTVLDEQYLRYDPSVLGYATMLLGLEMIPEELIPVHLRHCLVVRMSAVATLDSSDPQVLESFDCLRTSLEQSEKLPQVMDTIASKAALVAGVAADMDQDMDVLDLYHEKSKLKRAAASAASLSSSDSGNMMMKSNIIMHHSPRDVKIRISRGGSLLSSSSCHSNSTMEDSSSSMLASPLPS